MNSHFFFAKEIFNADDASQHFQQYDCEMTAHCTAGAAFHYSKRVCMLGESFVGCSAARYGWGLENRSELKGFLLTIPQEGEFRWENSNGSFIVMPGSIALQDQNSPKSARYSPGMLWVTIFLSYNDVFRSLTLLLGRPPKNKIIFQAPDVSKCVRDSMMHFVESILQFASHASVPLNPVTNHLKDGLINYFIYSFRNNYSEALFNASDVQVPAPFFIKKAVEYMERLRSPELTVNEVAAFTGVSVRCLQLGFKKFKGVTPMQYLRRIRLEVAREFLTQENSTMTLQEIAVQSGFSNFYLFKKYYVEIYFESPADTKAKNNSIGGARRIIT